MQIYGPFRVSTQSTSNVQSREIQQAGEVSKSDKASSTGETSASQSGTPVDELDLSQSASGASRMESTGAIAGEGIRFDRVAELRRQIADGTYDTPEKMDAALDRMLDSWG